MALAVTMAAPALRANKNESCAGVRECLLAECCNSVTARNNVRVVIQSLTQRETKRAGANKAFLDVRLRESGARKSLETKILQQQ